MKTVPDSIGRDHALAIHARRPSSKMAALCKAKLPSNAILEHQSRDERRRQRPSEYVSAMTDNFIWLVVRNADFDSPSMRRATRQPTATAKDRFRARISFVVCDATSPVPAMH